MSMFFPPRRIVKVPGSIELVKVRVPLLFGDDTLMRRDVWTDGYPPKRLDNPLWLSQHSGELFWTDECEDVGIDHAPLDVPHASLPGLDDYRRALDIGLATTVAKEVYIRMHYWWLANHPVRNDEPLAIAEADFRENLKRLRVLFDTNIPSERILAAEAARGMGEFADAAMLLEYPFPERDLKLVNLIARSVKERKSKVQVLVRTVIVFDCSELSQST
jgi:hypothetical protein